MIPCRTSLVNLIKIMPCLCIKVAFQQIGSQGSDPDTLCSVVSKHCIFSHFKKSLWHSQSQSFTICFPCLMHHSPLQLNTSLAKVLFSNIAFYTHIPLQIFPIFSLIIIIRHITRNGLRKNDNNDFRLNPLSTVMQRLYGHRIIQTHFINWLYLKSIVHLICMFVTKATTIALQLGSSTTDRLTCSIL